MSAVAEKPPAAPPATEVAIAYLGEFKRAAQSFAITAADVASWQANLAGEQRGRIAIDYDHRAAEGDTRAAGWVTGLRTQKRGARTWVVASVEWTAEGAAAIKARTYRGCSVEFVANLRDETGRGLGPALVGLALTNRPFLRGLPPVTLSGRGAAGRGPVVSLAALAAGNVPEPPAVDAHDGDPDREMLSARFAALLAAGAERSVALSAVIGDRPDPLALGDLRGGRDPADPVALAAAVAADAAVRDGQANDYVAAYERALREAE